MTTFDFEALYRFDDLQRTDQNGKQLLFCGIDEAGRGPLAGPVVAAAVILPPAARFEGLRDSKKLTEKRREALYAQILETAVSYGIGAADEKEIDTCNILNATYLAMRRAVAAMAILPDRILVDGNRIPDALPAPAAFQIHGDDISASIAAAAVLAKVTRDHYMTRLDKKYPEYGFAKHKGYGTQAHYAALRAYGISAVHRRSFVKNLIAEGVADRRTEDDRS